MPNTKEFTIYIPFVSGKEYLDKALLSVDKYQDNVHIIYHSTLPVSFSCMMNWMQDDAYKRNLKYFIFMHSDAECSIEPDGIELLLNKAKQLDNDYSSTDENNIGDKVNDNKWGVIFTHYDALCLFNPVATKDVGYWDESFIWYVADIDYYNRLRWAGWNYHNIPTACKVHHMSQTVKHMSNEQRVEVDENQSWAIAHYKHKWGCHWEDNSEGRIYKTPYNL